MGAEFETLFTRIRRMFKKHEPHCVMRFDEPDRYYLDTHEVREKDGYRTMFGGVEIKKNYVSAHLMPVYVHPELLEDVSEPLRKRMQGKSCFNFKKVDEGQLDDLKKLIDTGAERFSADGRLSN